MPDESVSVGSGRTFPAASGDLASLIRLFDWAKTGLGPLEAWPQSLKTVTETLLRSPVPIVLLWGEDGIMIYNDGYSVFAGGRHPHLLGSKVREGWPEVADFNDHVMKVGIGGGTLAYNDQELTLFRHGRPEQVWMHLDYSPVLNEEGKPAGVIAIVVETTQRVIAERRVRESEERFRLIANSAPIPVWVTQLNGDREFVNQAYLEFFGLEPQQALTFDWRKSVHPENIHRILAPEELPSLVGAGPRRGANPFCARTKTPARRSQTELLLNLAGGERLFDFAMRPITDQTGAVMGVVSDALDITERRRNEEVMRQSQKMEAVGQLTGGIAHDFNNLLTVIRSATDLLRRPDLPEARRGRYISAISDTIDRASKLTSQLLAFARRQPLRPETFSVAEQVESIAQLLMPALGNRIKINVDVPPEGCFALANVAQFETAAINLALNARDAMPNGGALTLRVAEVEILRAGKFVAVSVIDSGTGISRDKREKILSRSTRRRKSEGALASVLAKCSASSSSRGVRSR